MSDLPLPESDDPREQDHGELFRASPKHLAAGPLKPGDRKVLGYSPSQFYPEIG